MANNRGSSGRGRGRRGQSNNPDGRNQYGLMNAARGNPLFTATAVGGAVAAGVFLWSRRNQISDQLENLSEQIGEWRLGSTSDSDIEVEDGSSSETFVGGSGSRSQVEISEEALTLKETGKIS